ncbi:hypothetical protein HY994_00275 [Candidatus Micrarchaeota archaeon]|nr:hypothetical protein [Candidatus Micrarchaeota archaeon]
MKTYIEGFLDVNATDDRVNDLAGSTTLLGSASPFASGGRKISASDSPLVFKGLIADPIMRSGYLEEERYYLYAKSQYDSSNSLVKAKNPQMAYEATFTNPIPVCSKNSPLNVSCPDAYRTSTHRMAIKLLGADWLILGMDNFDSTSALNGQAVLTLGKEYSYNARLQIGGVIKGPNGAYAKLFSVSYGGNRSSDFKVSFGIYDSTNRLVDSTTLGPNSEYNQNGFILRVNQVLPGMVRLPSFAGPLKFGYVQASVLSDKLSLQQSSSVNSDNSNWRVNLVGGGPAFGASLARVQLVLSVASDLMPGDSLPFLFKPTLLKFTYNGLESVPTDTLSFSTGVQSFQTSATDTQTVDQHYVLVQSSLPVAFWFGNQTTQATNSFYYIVGNNSAGKATRGTVFYRDSTTGNFVKYVDSSATVDSFGQIQDNYVIYAGPSKSVRMQFHLTSNANLIMVPEFLTDVENPQKMGAFLFDVRDSGSNPQI